MARHFRIHPSVGVARVGNSPTEFFIGAEHPGVPANWQNGQFGEFRDAEGRIKRQAARFHVFEYADGDDGTVRPKEVVLGSDVMDIEWRVHIANKKGSFFTFNGQSGADDLYLQRAARPATDVEKENPRRLNLRNADVPIDRRRELEIDPGEVAVSRRAPGPAILTNPNERVRFISDLGEVRMDEQGRLLVLGGHGLSGSTDPAVTIGEYANNDTWFDDVGDGPVKARIHLADGSVVDADAAWVIVGPPDFVPEVPNAVTLYDLMWDLAVRQLPLPTNSLFRAIEPSGLARQKEAWTLSGGRALDGYEPSFAREIYPILSRAVAVRRLHEPMALDKAKHHVRLLNWEALSAKDGDPLHDDLRKYVVSRMRDPNGERIDWRGMPRGLGDDYDKLEEKNPPPTALFSLTQIQFALLQQWATGRFVEDWPGSEPDIPEAGAVSPTGLDRAALENCVGGPFFPGIEVSWLIRRPELYSEPFRLDVPRKPASEGEAPMRLGALTFGAGFFSQQMAQPWQADFYDCHKEESDQGEQPYYYMWWTAQRPDDTFAPGASEQQPWIRHIVPPGMDFEQFQESDDRFKQMVERWHELPFILRNADKELEEERR